jgi:hypothetical protein
MTYSKTIFSILIGPGVDLAEFAGYGRFIARAIATALASSVLVSLTACGGGGGDNKATGSQNNASQSRVALGSSQAEPFAPVSVTVESTASGGAHVAELDLGRGIVIPAPLVEVSPRNFTLTAPPGALDSHNKFISGTVIVRVKRTLDGQATYSEAKALEILPLATPPSERGKATLTLLEANKVLTLDSLGNLGVIQSKASPGLSINATAASANQAVAEINKMIATVKKVQSGEKITLGPVRGQLLVLDEASLAEMDRLAMGILNGATKNAKPKVKAQAFASPESLSSSLDDPTSIAKIMGAAAREVAGNVGQGAGLLLGVVGTAAVVLAAPEIAAAAEVLGAVSFMTTTLLGTSIGLVLDGGSAAIVDGKASLEDFKDSAKFFGSQYLDYALGYIADNALTDAFGEVGGSVISTGLTALQTYEQFTEEQVLPAYDSGTLASGGYPESSFSLTLSATDQPYAVTVRTVPAVSTARLRVQISGTDGYVYNSDTTATNGVAIFQPQAASPGSGIVDTINAFDIDGRALASTQVTF